MPLTPEEMREQARARKAGAAQPSEDEINARLADAAVTTDNSGQNGVMAAPEPRQERRIVRPGPRGWPEKGAQAERVTRAEYDALPHSVEAEQGVLGSMILDCQSVMPIVLQKISADFFFIPANQTIFKHASDLFQDEGFFNLITLTQYLGKVRQLDAVGGPAYVTSLYTFVPTAANITYYLEIVIDKRVRRQIIATATESTARAYEEGDLFDLIEVVQRRSEWLTTLVTPRTRLPALRDLSLMLGDNKPARPVELVKSMLHQGSKLIVGGTSKGRKTYSLIDLAVSVAAGVQWWGFDCVQGPVCYINFEIQESFFCDRVETICAKKGVILGPGMLVGWNLRGHGEGIENLVEEVLTELRKQKFVLIIFDPIYKALGNRDENKAGDVASMLNELERIAVRTGAAIAFGAHYSKGNQAAKESIDRIGGSGVFARDPDSILTMTAHEEDDAFTVDATLRNFAPLKPFVVRWDWPLFVRDTQLDPDELKAPRKVAGQYTTKYSKESLLDELSIVNGEKPTSILKRLHDQYGVSRTHFYRMALALREEKLIKEQDGLWFRKMKNE